MLVQDSAAYAIYRLDRSGRVQSWNPAAEHVEGYRAEEILGEPFARFFTESDRAAGLPDRALQEAAASGWFAVEAWHQRRNGAHFWASVAMDAIRHEGELLGFVTVTRDLSHERATQRAALESERRFRLLVQGVTDYAIIMLDPDGHVANWNAGAERIKGYAEPEIVGEHFSRFYTQEDRAQGLPELALAAAREHGRYEMESWRVRKDGTRFWANAVLDAIYDRGRLVGFAKITRDLTERRRVQLELDRSRETLLQSQKMEAVGQLTGGLAHDFNNMLAAITGSLELLKSRAEQGRFDQIDTFVGTALNAAGRAAALTQRLLVFSRRQAIDPKPVLPNQVIESLQELLQRTVGPQVRIETRLAPCGWPVLCDPNEFENALLNLCLNARDAMQGEGTVTISTTNLVLRGRAGDDLDVSPGEHVEIAITDTGPGMTEEVAQRAFEPFFTTKPAGQGTGLGLSMVYGFARQSGGQARIVTQHGAGTTIRIVLPRHAQAPAEEAEAAPHPAVRAAEPGKTVVVVDDEPTVRMLVTEVLEDLGLVVIEAGDGPSGLKLLQSDLPVDLLVTDVGLPGGLNGRQLADAAQSARPGLKVLFITGYAEAAVLGSNRPGAELKILTKPFALDVLGQTVTGLLNS